MSVLLKLGLLLVLVQAVTNVRKDISSVYYNDSSTRCPHKLYVTSNSKINFQKMC